MESDSAVGLKEESDSLVIGTPLSQIQLDTRQSSDQDTAESDSAGVRSLWSQTQRV